jgi:acetylornithine deacetylase/succinyl-diaminopimelate desuccinylase-like protein
MSGLSASYYKKVLSQLSGGRTIWLDGVEKLITTRYVGTQGNNDAAGWIADICEGFGMEVEVQQFYVSGLAAAQYNVVCKLHPTFGETNNVVVIGAHYDSTASNQDKYFTAPGAIDNGSGASGVLALAKIFRGYGMDCTMHFVLFGAEEIGIHGSAFYLDEMVRLGKTIFGAFILDMIGYSNQYFGVKVEFSKEGDFVSKILVNTLVRNYVRVANESNSAFTVARSSTPYGSDHMCV